MKRDNRFIVLIVIILLVLLSLAGFYLYLSGGVPGSGGDDTRSREGADGLIHVRTIRYYGAGERLLKPVGIGADDDGGFFVTLRDVGRVIEFDRDGDEVRSWGVHGTQPGELLSPTGVAVDRAAGHVYVTDRGRLRLLTYAPDGNLLWEVPLLGAVAPAVTPDGILVSTHGPIAQFDVDGRLQSETGVRGEVPGAFDFPRSLVAVSVDEVYVADTNNNRVQRVALNGEVTATVSWAAGLPTRRQDDATTLFGLPSGITLDASSRLVVLDSFRQEIVVMDKDTGEILHTFTDLEGDVDGTFRLPTAIVHLHDDYFAVTDTFNDRVQIIRLLTPDELTVVSRYPWARWLPALLVLLLPLFIGRKRVLVTSGALERARSDENLRLLVGVHRRLRVLPEVAERFADVTEVDLRLGDFLDPYGAEDTSAGGDRSPDASGGSPGDEESRLAQAVKDDRRARLLLTRFRVLADDGDQLRRLDDVGLKGIGYDSLVEEYRLG